MYADWNVLLWIMESIGKREKMDGRGVGEGKVDDCSFICLWM